MSLPTPEQWLPLGGIILAVALAVLTVAALVRRTRRRRTAPVAAERDRAAEEVAPADPSRSSGPAAGWREPEPARPEPAGPEPTGPAPTTRTVADAVQRALSVREARGGDVRDRLLAVLLEDPVRAVGATVELDTCRRQLDRLSGAVEHERAALRAVLTRLTATGLSDEQLARLAGLPVDDVRGLLGEDRVDRAGPGRAGSARDALQPR